MGLKDVIVINAKFKQNKVMKNMSPTIQATMYKSPHLIVCGQTNGTNTPTQSTDTTTKNATKGTSEQLKLVTSPTTTSSVVDSLVKLSQLLEKEGDSKTLGELYSTKYAESLKKSNLAICCLRM